MSVPPSCECCEEAKLKNKAPSLVPGIVGALEIPTIRVSFWLPQISPTSLASGPQF